MNSSLEKPSLEALAEDELETLIPHIIDGIQFGYELGSELVFVLSPDLEFYQSALGDFRHHAVNKKVAQVVRSQGFSVEIIPTDPLGYFFIQIKHRQWTVSVRKTDETPYGITKKKQANYFLRKRYQNELFASFDNNLNEEAFVEIVHTPKKNSRDELESVEMFIVTPSGITLAHKALKIPEKSKKDESQREDSKIPKPLIEVIQ